MAVHWLVDGHATEARPPYSLSSTGTAVGLPGEVGLNVTSFPPPVPRCADPMSTRVHWLVEGHATAVGRPPPRSTLSTLTATGLPGEVGSNVTSSPLRSTAVHWLVEGHATDVRWPLLSSVTGVGLPGEAGSNVTSCPW